MKLGVLDLSVRIEETVTLAPLADQLGYSRYWISEFPPQPSPLQLAGIVAGLTERISVGTAAILFSYYPPRRTAHDFQLLERLYEGRIDAGVSASTSLPRFSVDDIEERDAAALAAAYPARFATFLKHLRNTPASPQYDEELAWPGAPEEPPRVFSLGSGRSAALAAAHGTGYGYPLMYASSVDDPATLAGYRAAYQPSRSQPAPCGVLAVAGYCAATDEEAHAIAAPWAIFAPHVVGSAATCAKRLAALRIRYGADEIIWGDLSRTPGARHVSLERLAEAVAREPDLR